MKRNHRITLFAVLISLSLACNFLSGSQPSPAPTAAMQATAVSTPTENTAPPAGQPTAPPESGGDTGTSGSIQDVTALAHSYRLSIHTTWQPDGQEAQPSDIFIERTLEPDAEHIRVVDSQNTVDTYRIGTQTTMCTSETDCFSMQDANATPLLSKSDMSLSFLNDPEVSLQKAGSETIDGLEVTHYIITLSPATFAQLYSEGEVSNPQSEVWVAEHHPSYPPFVVRWMASWDEVRNGVSGKSTLDYRLSDLDAAFTIQAPEDQAAGGNVPADLTAYPNAQQTLSMAGTYIYSTTDSIQEVTDYYAQALPAQGWTLQEDTSMAGVMTLQTWHKGDQTLTLTITHDESSNTTSIILNQE
ncbi:MAG: hypothetical protein Fur0018_03820 [Anaerolineales bacterium]